MKFPHPKNHDQYFIFKDGYFENFFKKEEKYKVLVYSENFDGWNDDLTNIKDLEISKNHPIDVASIEMCNYMLENYAQEEDKVILEIGCLNGNLSKKIIEQKKYEYIGSDALQNNIIKLANKFKSIPFIVFDITQNPFKSKICNILIMLNILEHIEDDDKALNEAYKLLNDNGKLIVEVPSCKFLYDNYDKKLLHYRRYDAKEIIKKILNAGFVIEKKTHLGFLTFPIFALVKLFNKFFNPNNIIEKEIKASDNIFIKFLFKIELKLIKFNLPFGIRTVICAKKKQL